MNRILSALIILLFCLCSQAYGDQAQDGTDAGNAVGADIASQLNTGAKLNDRFSAPLTSSESPLKTFGKPADQVSFDGQITAQSSSSFLEIFVQPGATGDLGTVIVKQDLDFDTTAEYVFHVPVRISGVCANGFISCNAGTWENCSYYNWQTDASLQIGVRAAGGIRELAACYCINNSCGSDLVWSNISHVLKDIGGAVVGAIQDTNPQYTITNVSVDNTLIRYYGQVSSEAGSRQGAYFSGSDKPEEYYNPTSSALPVDDLLIAQSEDSESYYYQINESLAAQNSPVEIETCFTRRQIVFINDNPHIDTSSTCTTIDLTDCNLKQVKVCDYNNKKCVVTLDNYNSTGLTPLESCTDLLNGSDPFRFCASGTGISKELPLPTATLLSGTDIWWNINHTFQCDSDNDYNADTGIDKAAVAQDSATLINGTATYEDYDSDTGTVITRSFSLATEENPEKCETACKVKAPITDTEASNSGVTLDYRKTVNSTTFFIRNCDQGTCPTKAGETIEKDCSCLNNFPESTAVMQTLYEASRDIVCSSRNLP